MSAAMRKQQAVLAVSSVIANILPTILSIQTQLIQMYDISGYQQQGWTFKRWIMAQLKAGLNNKNNFYFNAPGMSSIVVHNPYSSTSIPGMVEVPGFPQDLLFKFWMELADDANTFTVNGMVGITHLGELFEDIIDKPYNVLGLSLSEEIGGDLYVKYNNMWLINDAVPAVYILAGEEIQAEQEFFLTDTAPTA